MKALCHAKSALSVPSARIQITQASIHCARRSQMIRPPAAPPIQTNAANGARYGSHFSGDQQASSTTTNAPKYASVKVRPSSTVLPLADARGLNRPSAAPSEAPARSGAALNEDDRHISSMLEVSAAAADE